MEELVKIENQMIGGETIPTIDAHELWEKLEVKTPFNHWITRRVRDAQLIEGIDFISLDKIVQREIGGTVRREYYLSLDSGKHIAMLEGNTKGKEIRQYFINYEKNTRQALKILANSQINRPLLPVEQADIIIKSTQHIGELLGAPKHLVQVEAVNKVQELTGLDYTKLLTVSKDCDNIQEADVYLEPSEIGKRLGLVGDVRKTGRIINGFLLYVGWQTSINGDWDPTEKAKTQHLCSHHFWKVETVI